MNVTVDGLALSITRHPGHAHAGAVPVIYVHGGTFPAALAIGWRFADGRSWADDLTAAGHDLWSFNFVGFGTSARYREMAVAPVAPPLGRSDSAVRQLAAVIGHVQAETGSRRVALLAHSWGCTVAARCAAEQPDAMERLVLFAPIVRRELPDMPDATKLPGWMPMPLAAQLKRFREDVPAGEPELVTDAMFEPWGAAYLATDPRAQARTPPSVAIPMGPQADIAAIWSRHLPYDPARITCPVAIVRGGWDSLCTDNDVAWLKGALAAAPSVTDAKLERGTHLMHLETGRTRLWIATRNALADVRRAAIDTHAVLFEVHPSAGGRDDYLATAASLRPLLDEVDGFVSIERFASEKRPDWILSLSFWVDDAAIAAWRSRDRHHAAQVKGRGGMLQDYRLRVARVRWDGTVEPDRQPKPWSSYNDPSRRSTQPVVVVEVVGDPAGFGSLLNFHSDSATGETYSSLTTPSKRAHLLRFDDEAAWRRWMERAKAVLSPSSGTHRIRTMEVLRDYGMFDRAQAPQYYPEPGRTGAACSTNAR